MTKKSQVPVTLAALGGYLANSSLAPILGLDEGPDHFSWAIGGGLPIVTQGLELEAS